MKDYRARDTLVDFHTGTSKDARLDERLLALPDLLGHPRVLGRTGGARLPAVAARVESKFQAPHAIDATSSLRLRLLDGVEVDRCLSHVT